MVHDPSSCPRCRWAAEQLGYKWLETSSSGWMSRDYYWKGTAPDGQRCLESFCTSLDALAGLMKELFREGWEFSWSEERQQWCIYFRTRLGLHHQYLSDDYSCVIEAAKQVLGEKESDG